MLTRVDFYTHVVSATVFKPFGMFLNDNARWIKREQWSASFYILISHVLKSFIKNSFLQNPVDLDRFWLTDNVHDLWYTEGEWGHVFGSGLNDLLI